MDSQFFVVVTDALFDLASSDKISQDSERLYYQFFGEKHDLNLEDLGPSRLNPVPNCINLLYWKS